MGHDAGASATAAIPSAISTAPPRARPGSPKRATSRAAPKANDRPPTANATSIEPASASVRSCFRWRWLAKNANGPYSTRPSTNTVATTRRAHGRASTARHCATRLGRDADAAATWCTGSRSKRASDSGIIDAIAAPAAARATSSIGKPGAPAHAADATAPPTHA